MHFQSIQQKNLSSFIRLLEKEHLCFEDIDLETQSYEAIVDQGKIAGGFGLEYTQEGALLRSVVLDTALRGQGIGKALVQRALTLANQKGVQQLYLLTTTAASFFSDQGFEEISRSSVPEPVSQTVEFNSFCPDTAVCMKITIPAYV